LLTTLERINNRMVRYALRKGLAPKAFALLETTGRRSGLPRHTPVGNGLDGDVFWLVAAHGTQAANLCLLVQPKCWPTIMSATSWRNRPYG
jgi:hypothetical protein